MDIIGVQAKNGYYIKEISGASYSSSSLGKLLINGVIPKPSFHPHWFIVDNKPETIERFVRQPRANHRFELITDSPFVGNVSNWLPPSMPKHEVMEKNEDGYCGWKKEFQHLQSLYVEVSDEQPDKIESIEFTYTTVLEVGEIKTTDDFSYTVQKTQWAHEGKTELGVSAIINQEIDKAIFPEVVLPNRPCMLPSTATYKIIREHVKRNIDSRYAEVTSDYDFCFSVAKIVPLKAVVERRVEIKNAAGRSYRKPRFKEFLVKSRQVKNVFEMTHTGNPYQGYTPIKGFNGKDHQDLKNNIDKYLDDLMARINEPLVDCPQCGGLGVVIENTK